MSKRQIIILLGVCVIFLPYLGFTVLWNKILTIFVGVLIIGIAYRMAPLVKMNDGGRAIPGAVNSPEQKEMEKNTPTDNLPFVDHRNVSEDATNIR